MQMHRLARWPNAGFKVAAWEPGSTVRKPGSTAVPAAFAPNFKLLARAMACFAAASVSKRAKLQPEDATVRTMAP